MTEFDDPFQPDLPGNGEIGRLFATQRLVAGWQCRWCPNLLAATPTGGLICLTCDTHPEMTR